MSLSTAARIIFAPKDLDTRGGSDGFRFFSPAGPALRCRTGWAISQASCAATDGSICREHRQAAWNVTGDDDFLLTVQVPSMEAYDAFTRDELGNEAHVRTFRTLIAIRSIGDNPPARRGITIG